jgi:hypothetical protein
VRCEQGC